MLGALWVCAVVLSAEPTPAAPSVLEPTPSAAADPRALAGAAPDDAESDEDGLRAPDEEGTHMESLGFRQRYFPVWFPSDMHPQLEDMKWTYVLGSIFVVTSAFWSPHFMVNPAPRVDFRELLKTALIRFGIHLGGIFGIYAGWLVLGLVCPPIYGFYIWLIPMYVALGVWNIFATWQTIMSLMVVWDASLKDQGVPEGPSRPKGKPAKAAKPRPAKTPRHSVED